MGWAAVNVEYRMASASKAPGAVEDCRCALKWIVRNAREYHIDPARLVVTGHSAGGQFVTRYEMANRVHDTLGVQVRYVVANPSSYAYPDSTRPTAVKGKIDFRQFKGRACDSYNRWPYGLAERSGYAKKATVDELRKHLVERPTTYLLGERDVRPVDGFDASCAAMAQGATRLARGRAFAAYVNQRLGAHHAVKIVPDCGHDAVCMFTADSALAVLFPK